MIKKILIITSNDIRHNYFKIMFSNNNYINVIKTFVESDHISKLNFHIVDTYENYDISGLHFISRHNTEYDFFSDIIDNINDNSNSNYINKGEVNSTEIVEEIISLQPDLIITYGCSIIKSRILESFKRKIINVHLGLSPYYFGAGTNYHALVNNDFQCVGYTFMYMDEGIDTGEIIHQSRARILPNDSPHQIGNRLIKDMTKDFIKLVVGFNNVQIKTQVTFDVGKTFKKNDASAETDMKLYKNFKEGSVITYLRKRKSLEKKFPIIEQDFIRD
jgi:phosphoribosylglycinamide formyltransferase 1